MSSRLRPHSAQLRRRAWRSGRLAARIAAAGDSTRVRKFPIHERTVSIAIWIADNAIQPVIVPRHIDLARAALEKCGVDLQVQSIDGFSAGALLDLEVVDLTDDDNRCGNPLLERTGEEAALLDASIRRRLRRS